MFSDFKPKVSRVCESPFLFEYLENSYNVDVTIDPVDEHLVTSIQNLWTTHTSPQRNVTLYTGTGGMELFINWVEEKFGDNSLTINF